MSDFTVVFVDVDEALAPVTIVEQIVLSDLFSTFVSPRKIFNVLNSLLLFDSKLRNAVFTFSD